MKTTVCLVNLIVKYTSASYRSPTPETCVYPGYLMSTWKQIWIQEEDVVIKAFDTFVALSVGSQRPLFTVWVAARYPQKSEIRVL